jgi:hypothetical protein
VRARPAAKVSSYCNPLISMTLDSRVAGGSRCACCPGDRLQVFDRHVREGRERSRRPAVDRLRDVGTRGMGPW